MQPSLDFMLYASLFLFITVVELNATITEGPSNTVAEIGQQVKLSCIASAPVAYWYLSKNGVVADEVIVVGPGCSALNAAYTDHYSVESLGGGTTCNLIVSNITMEHAGVYRCIEGTFQSLSILTVQDKSPTLTYNTTENVVTENDTVIITCSLNYNGSVSPAPTLRPYFYWTNINGQNVSSSYDSTTDNPVVSQLTVKAGRQDIMPYTCHIYFQLEPAATGGYASNIPTVSKSASSPTIEVLCLQTLTTPCVTTGVTTESTTTSEACSCEPVSTGPTLVASDSNCVVSKVSAIALGSILFISIVLNVIQLIFLIRKQRTKHDPLRRPDPIRRPEPERVDPSNGMRAPSTYEELTRSNLEATTYEELTPRPQNQINQSE